MIAEVSDYLNEHTNGGDVVLTYSWMTQLLTAAQGGIVIQALAYDGYNAAYYPGNYPKERWAFNTSLSNAKYIVLSEEDKKNFGGKDEKSHSVLVAELGRRSIAFNNGLEVYGPRVQSSP